MKTLRKISKEYYVRQIMTSWLAFYMFFCFGMPVRVAMATPAGGVPVISPDTGDANITYNTGDYNHTTQVGVLTNRTIIDWNSLDTAGGLVEVRETLKFTQGDLIGSAVLNRVSGPQTQFNGDLIAGGMRIFIVNPAGIIFGQGAKVNVTQLVASSLKLTNDAFINGLNTGKFQFTDGDGAVINYGQIGNITPAQSVALIGKMVQNTGIITTTSGGYVAMVAGDRVLLAEQGSNIVVEAADSVASATPIPALGPNGENINVTAGDVINSDTGTINAPEGQVVLAAGDIFSTALSLDNKAVKVDGGIGTVEQNGNVHADGDTGDGGTVSLTAGDEVILGPDSQTTANAVPDGTSDDRPIGGRIVISSPGKVTIDPAAQLVAKGNGYYDAADNGRFDIPDDTDFRGSVQITGKYITPPAYVDLSAWSGDTEQAGYLTIGPYEGDLIIANGPQMPDPAANTIYEGWIEQQSGLGVNVDLLSPGNITAQTLSSDLDPGLGGGSGDLSFRTLYDNGSITFDTQDVISTNNGGNIFMVAGSGGITVGDIKTQTSGDKSTDSGQIFLLTARPEDATEGGDITTGSLQVTGGGNSEISAIAAGTLTVNGDVTSIRNQVPADNQIVGKALICLIGAENVILNADVIKVETHGKFKTHADICISAGWDVTIENTQTKAGSVIIADAKSSQSGPYTADASVDILAGWNKKDAPGVIKIDGINYNGEPGGDNSDLPITVTASVSKIGGPSKITPSDSWSEDDPYPLVDPSDGSSKLWQEEQTKDSARQTVTLQIDNTEGLTPSDVGSPCYDCPRPPFLPPIPVIFWLADDTSETNWRSGNIDGIDPAVLDVLLNDNGKDDSGNLIPLLGVSSIIIDGVAYDTVGETIDTDKGGKLQLVLFEYQGQSYMGFVYTPPTDQEFVWDGGTSAYASFTDTFQYQAEKEVDGRMVTSKNTATVTITVKNILPVANPASGDVHMNTVGTQTIVDIPLSVTDIDGSPQPLIYEPGSPASNGDASINNTTATYEPDDYYVGGDSFDFTVSDASILTKTSQPVASTGTVSVDVTNEGPTAVTEAATEHMTNSLTTTIIDPLGGAYDNPDGVLLDPITVILDNDINGDGIIETDKGTITLVSNIDGTYSFKYTAKEGATGQDVFTYTVSDGDLSRSQEGTLTVNLTNEGPTAVTETATEHMSNSLNTTIVDPFGGAYDNPDGGILDPLTVVLNGDGGDGIIETDKGTIMLVSNIDGTYSFKYTAKEGATGQDVFTYTVTDGDLSRSQEGTLTVNLTNVGPFANDASVSGNVNTAISGGVTFDDLPDIFANDEVDPLTVEILTNPANGTLTFFDPVTGQFTYIPNSGYVGPDSITYSVTDGQQDLQPVIRTISINVLPVEQPEPVLPPPPLPLIRFPKAEGCPVMMQAVAAELGVTTQTIQVSFDNAAAVAPNIQPCFACERVVSYAETLRDVDGSYMAAMAQVFNTLAPPDAPFTPEMGAAIATAFAENLNNPDMPQYAKAMEYIDAFVGYVTVLDDQMGSPVGDSMAFVMGRYGEPLRAGDNANMMAYVEMRIAQTQGL